MGSTTLPFLSDKPLEASPRRGPETLGEAMSMPKAGMIELADDELRAMRALMLALACDVLTDGEDHFLLMCGFACRL